MKKVNFYKHQFFAPSELNFLSDGVINEHFEVDNTTEFLGYICTESFTAEITVKIVPYES